MKGKYSFQEQLKQVKNPSLKIIGEYLARRYDLKEKLENQNKSLEECWSYIVGEASKQAQNNCAFMSDEEVFGLAVHYYDEDEITVKGVKERTQVKVVKEKLTTSEPLPATRKKKAKAKENPNQLSFEV